jgi:polysaccharide pyruvyl transferase WcaK-like protein
MERPVKHPKVLLLGVSFNTRNMGVGALAAGAVKCIRHWQPGADIKLLDYGKKAEIHNINVAGKDELIELINLRFSKKLFLPNNVALLIALAAIAKLLPFKPVRRLFVDSNEYLREISSADMAASVAGGDSFSDIYGIGRFFYVALPQLLVLLMGKPLVQLPQTIGPFTSKLPRRIAAAILRRSSLIYSRDYPGLLETREILGISGKNERIRFCYDMGFVLDPVKPAGHQAERGASELPGSMEVNEPCRVGLNVSGLLYMGGYTRGNMFGLKSDYRELVAGIIDFLITRKKATVVLVPHVFGGPETESDSAVCERLYAELKPRYGERLSFLSGVYDQGEIKHMIGTCDFFIGSRMHACIAALSQCIPSVPVAYSRKFIGVMESIGVDSYVADPCTLDPGAVLDIIDKAFEDRAAIAEKLRAQMPGVKEKILGLFREIHE